MKGVSDDGEIWDFESFKFNLRCKESLDFVWFLIIWAVVVLVCGVDDVFVFVGGSIEEEEKGFSSMEKKNNTCLFLFLYFFI
jgi:hypothetical protein